MIEQFLASHAYSLNTKRTYTDILSRFLSAVNEPQTLNAADLLKWIDSTGWGSARQCLALACTQKYLRWQFGASHPALGAKIKRRKGKLQRAINQNQLDALLATFDRFTPKGARDLAMAALMVQSGFRCAEICSLLQADVDTEHGTAQVVVKGGNYGVGIFNPDTAAHIEWWKKYREDLNPQGGYLFVSLKSGYIGKGLTPEGLNRVAAAWGAALDIKLSPHDFRRSLATITSENGGNDRGIMEAGRWKNQETFTGYTRNYRIEAIRKFLPNTKG